jgi:small subunit ribosomal protein S6
MRDYEIIFVVHPDLEETATEEIVDRIGGWITEGGGSVEEIDSWGKRKLAYPIRKQIEGQYFLLHTQLDPSFVIEMERNLRFLEPVMRFLITAKE